MPRTFVVSWFARMGPVGLAVAVAGLSSAQSTAVVPPVCATLPGNVALAMPLRWSHGTMQVFVDPPMLPTGFVGSAITGLWLRRPTIAGDGAYAATTRTLTVRGGFSPVPAAAMGGPLSMNRPTNVAVLFGPAPVTSVAVAAPGATTTVGADLLHIVFSQPLVVTAGTMFLEFETSNSPLSVSTDHWVDGVWQQGGVDSGYVVPVGDGSCTTRPEPTRLTWTAAQGPSAGGTATFQLSGAPTAAAFGYGFAWLGIDPVTRGAGPGYFGFGGSWLPLDPAFAGCYQWAPADALWSGATDVTGAFTVSFTVPGAAALGQQLGLQGAWWDTARPGVTLSFSNGLTMVVGSAGIGDRCNTMFFPASVPISPWPPFVGQMPVLRLEY